VRRRVGRDPPQIPKLILPALLPVEILIEQDLELDAAKLLIEGELGGHMADDQYPLTIPPGRYVQQESRRPSHCLPPTLAAGIGPIEPAAALEMYVRSWSAVEVAVVTLA
jgi:hypothetical protein